jgi:hypothetical protein
MDDGMKVLFDKANRLVVKNELVLVFILVSIVLLKWLSMPFINLISIVVLISIASLYYGAVINGKEGLTENQSVVYKLTGMSSGIIVIGILFSLLRWPNSQMMLIIGCLSLIGVLLAIEFLKKMEYNLLTPNMKVRFAVLLILGGFFLLGFY